MNIKNYKLSNYPLITILINLQSINILITIITI